MDYEILILLKLFITWMVFGVIEAMLEKQHPIIGKVLKTIVTFIMVIMLVFMLIVVWYM